MKKESTTEHGTIVAAPTHRQKGGIACILSEISAWAREKVILALKPEVGDLRIVVREELPYKQKRAAEKAAKKSNVPLRWEVQG